MNKNRKQFWRQKEGIFSNIIIDERPETHRCSLARKKTKAWNIGVHPIITETGREMNQLLDQVQAQTVWIKCCSDNPREIPRMIVTCIFIHGRSESDFKAEIREIFRSWIRVSSHMSSFTITINWAKDIMGESLNEGSWRLTENEG
jgi:hypothetical protein